jgi:hypothetical protein
VWVLLAGTSAILLIVGIAVLTGRSQNRRRQQPYGYPGQWLPHQGPPRQYGPPPGQDWQPYGPLDQGNGPYAERPQGPPPNLGPPR